MNEDPAAQAEGGTSLADLSLAWQTFGCSVCGQVARPNADGGWRIELHHIVARSRGGTDDPENLMGLCGELLPNKCHWRVTTNRMKIEWHDGAKGYVWTDTRTGETGLCRPLNLEMADETGLSRALTAPVELAHDRALRRRPVPAERATAIAEQEGFVAEDLTSGGLKGAERRFNMARDLNHRAERAWMALAVVIQKAQEMGDAGTLGFTDIYEWAEAMGVNKTTMSKLRTIGMQFAGAWEMLPEADKKQLSMEGLYVAARLVRMGHWDEDTALTEAVAQPTHVLYKTLRETQETGAAPYTVETHACPTCGQFHAIAKAVASE